VQDHLAIPVDFAPNAAPVLAFGFIFFMSTNLPEPQLILPQSTQSLHRPSHSPAVANNFALPDKSR
jgi:hypothetical protein